MKMRLSIIAVAMAALLVACSGGTASTADPSTADITVTAADMAFDTDELRLSAGEAVTLALVNEDAMPHNIVIYTDESKSEKLFEGEVVTDGTVAYDIPALDAGTYYFDCSVHPDMNGTVVVS
jgi:plastocyanin